MSTPWDWQRAFVYMCVWLTGYTISSGRPSFFYKDGKLEYGLISTDDMLLVGQSEISSHVCSLWVQLVVVCSQYGLSRRFTSTISTSHQPVVDSLGASHHTSQISLPLNQSRSTFCGGPPWSSLKSARVHQNFVSLHVRPGGFHLHCVQISDRSDGIYHLKIILLLPNGV